MSVLGKAVRKHVTRLLEEARASLAVETWPRRRQQLAERIARYEFELAPTDIHKRKPVKIPTPRAHRKKEARSVRETRKIVGKVRMRVVQGGRASGK